MEKEQAQRVARTIREEEPGLGFEGVKAVVVKWEAGGWCTCMYDGAGWQQRQFASGDEWERWSEIVRRYRAAVAACQRDGVAGG